MVCLDNCSLTKTSHERIARDLCRVFPQLYSPTVMLTYAAKSVEALYGVALPTNRRKS